MQIRHERTIVVDRGVASVIVLGFDLIHDCLVDMRVPSHHFFEGSVFRCPAPLQDFEFFGSCFLDGLASLIDCVDMSFLLENYVVDEINIECLRRKFARFRLKNTNQRVHLCLALLNRGFDFGVKIGDRSSIELGLCSGLFS